MEGIIDLLRGKTNSVVNKFIYREDNFSFLLRYMELINKQPNKAVNIDDIL